QIPSPAPVRIQQQTVISLRSAGIVGSQVAEIGLRIREIEQPPLIDISRGRTRTWRRETVLAGTARARNVLRGIQLGRVLDVNDVRADVRGCNEQVRCRLALDTEVPRILRRSFH